MAEDLTIGQLPAAEKLEDSGLMVMETASGRAQHLTVAQLRQAVTPAAALALVRQLLGKAVYTEDVTADLAALDVLLGGGEPPDEPDEPVVPPEEPETDSGLELIAMYTLPEDVTSVTIDKDDNGQPYELDFAVLNVDVVGSKQNTGNGDMQIRINGNSEYPTVVPGRTTAEASQHKYIGAKIICGDYVHLYADRHEAAITAGMDTTHNSLSSLVLEGITTARTYLGAGTKIALYGHRKEG